MEVEKKFNLNEWLHNPIILCAGAIVIIFIILICMEIFGKGNPYGEEVTITNWNDYAELPDAQRSGISRRLRTLAIDSGKTANELKSVNALIRDGTVKTEYNQQTDVHSGRFIVDIDKIQQSYVVEYEWSENKNNPNVSSTNLTFSCPTGNDLYYNSEYCEIVFGSDPTLSAQTKLMSNTPYQGWTNAGDSYFVYTRYYSGGAAYAEVSANVCKDETKKAEVLGAYFNWIESLGVKKDDLAYEYRGLCKGGAM